MPPKRGVKRSQDDAALDSSVNPFTLAARKAKKTENGPNSSPASARAEAAALEDPVVVTPVDQPEEQQPTTSRTTRARTAAAVTSASTPKTTKETPASITKPKAKPKAKTPAPKAKNADKTYRDTLKTIDKAWNDLQKKYKPNPTVWSGVTADDFAKQMEAKFLPTVKALSDSGDTMLAFMLLHDIGEHSYGNLEFCFKASGWGDTDEPFKRMDACMVELIARLRDEMPNKEDPAESAKFIIEPSKDMGTEWDELYSEMDTKRPPNKQKRGWLAKARVDDLKVLFQRRRERRDTILEELGNGEAGDWAGSALNALVETRKRIDGYGIGEWFFAESIKALAAIKGVEAPGLR
ncbi:putative glycoside hydrolase family 43 protein [Naviculisporaceae sp. PSN 640]